MEAVEIGLIALALVVGVCHAAVASDVRDLRRGPCQCVHDAHLHIGCNRATQQALRLGSRHDFIEVRPKRPDEPVQVAHNQHYHSCFVPVHFGVVLHSSELQDDGRCEATEERFVPCNRQIL